MAGGLLAAVAEDGLLLVGQRPLHQRPLFCIAAVLTLCPPRETGIFLQFVPTDDVVGKDQFAPMVIVLLWATHPKVSRNIAVPFLLFLPLDGFYIGQVKEFATILLNSLAHFQFAEIYVGILVLDVLGIKGI